MRAGVPNAPDARGPLVGGGVADRVHPDRFPANTRAQLVDERVPDGADSRRFAGNRERTPPGLRDTRRQTQQERVQCTVPKQQGPRLRGP